MSLFSIGSMNQLGDALENAGFTPKDVTKLKQYKDLSSIKKLLYGEATITIIAKAVEELIQYLGTTVVPAQGEFSAQSGFRLKEDGGLCSDFGDNFRKWFLNGDGKIEQSAPEAILAYGKLLRRSKDDAILSFLGGEKVAETRLSSVAYLMSQQANKEDGVLLTNRRANIFYVRDRDSVLRAVRVRWHDDGWYVNACTVESPYDWFAGFRVFSRKSSEALKP